MLHRTVLIDLYGYFKATLCSARCHLRFFLLLFMTFISSQDRNGTIHLVFMANG